MSGVFLTIMFDEEADKKRVEQVVEKFSNVQMFKFSTGLYYSGDKTHGEALLFELGKLGYKMTVLH